jgi:predicted Zn-dependent protease
VGLTILDSAGFDVRAMPAFFTTMQRGTRLVEGSAPSFLRTHPLTAERIADVSNRVQTMTYKQVNESLDFNLARAKIRAAKGFPQTAIDDFEDNIKEQRFNHEVAEHYGLALAYLRKNDVNNASKQMQWLTLNSTQHPNFANLAARIEVANRQPQKASALFAKGMAKYPTHRSLIYGYAEHYLDLRQPDQAIKLVQEKMVLFPADGYFYELLAKAYASKGKVLLQHQAQAESYYRKYDLNRAIEQMDLAVKAKDGNFYENSIVEARLKELRRLRGDDRLDKGNA